MFFLLEGCVVIVHLNSNKNKEEVIRFIRTYILEVVKWTSLKLNLGSLDVDIPYRLVYLSKSPWGYYFRYPTSKGFIYLNPCNSIDMEKITAFLLQEHCTTKYGNCIDGRATLYEFVPRAKKFWKG